MAHLEIDRLKLPGDIGLDVHGIDLRVEKGAICCVYSRHAENLRGLADAVAGIGDDYEGRIFIEGMLIDNKPPGRRGVAICGADIGLYEHIPAVDNLAIPLKNNGLSSMDIRARVELVLESLGISGVAGKYPEELDPGERLRLSFAKAALSQPSLLVCDLIQPSPSGFSAYKLLDLLKSNAHGMSLTILALTDDPFFALNIADNIAYLGFNRIFQQGTPKEIVNSPEYIDVAEDFAYPRINIFEGKVVEETPFLLAEDGDFYFNLPERLRQYFRINIGGKQKMAVRPDKVQFLAPDAIKRKGKNIITVERLDYLGFGTFAYFKFGKWDWCAFAASDKVLYTGMQTAVYVPEDEWFFVDDTGKVLLDL